jgi:general secretion pathway protein B
VSFILDALRKSEHERQRQTGPGLAEVPVATHNPRSNVWATAAIALLLVNLIAVGVLLLRRAQHQDAATTAATATPAAQPDAAGPAPQAGPANPTLQPAAPGGPVTQGAAPVAAPPPSAAAPTRPPVSVAPQDSARNPLADEVGAAGAGPDPEMAGRAASVPQGPPAVSTTPRRGSVVYAPIPEAGDAPYAEPPAASTAEPAAPPAVSRTAPAPAAEALPGADEMTARGGLPELHLDLHVYANAPTQRFIFVNSRKYREGETMQEGPVVEQITPDGAVLNYRGSRFKLSH